MLAWEFMSKFAVKNLDKDYETIEHDGRAIYKAQMVELIKDHNLKTVAKKCYIDPKSLRAWRNIYEVVGLNGLLTENSTLDIANLEWCLEKYFPDRLSKTQIIEKNKKCRLL